MTELQIASIAGCSVFAIGCALFAAQGVARKNRGTTILFAAGTVLGIIGLLKLTLMG